MPAIVEPRILALPPVTDAPRRARHWASVVLQQWGWDDDGEVELVVSELCSNALLHVGRPFVLTMAKADDRLHVEVWDSSGEPPVRRLVPPDAPAGRGLRMVSHVANWGWRQDTGGKVVWADLLKPEACAMD